MRYFILLFVLFFIACQNSVPTADSTPFKLDTSAQPQWAKDGLRLYPITAEADFIAAQAAAAQYKVLSEAMQQARFRITEKKPFGRFEDHSAVNTLTVQNKTDEPVLLLAGEVVQGGNQDRVIAEDRVIAAHSIEDIPVFCVERGRWTYEGDHAIDEIDKQVFAFRGYYQMADSKVRRAVRRGNQGEVWEKVAAITTAMDAAGTTGAYANLEHGKDFVAKRANYQRYFQDKLSDNSSIVGFVATYEDRIIGADLFGHPALLNRQFSALLNSYATDAIAGPDQSQYSEEHLRAFARKLFAKATRGEGLAADGVFLHLSELP
ncbi:MAG: hypothetical protein D6772_05010 [Bacteroidetes bacterium]|nr:MAG: hypothetical protein D6772_05010 [Bacteroidota bacterium]